MAGCRHHAAMKALQPAGFANAAGMRDDANLVMHLLCVAPDPLGLVGWVETSLQTFIVRRDTGRAGILVTLQRLDAAEGEHVSARGSDEICTDAQSPGGFGRGDEFAARDDPDAVT